MFVIVAHHEVGVLWADLNVSGQGVKSGRLTNMQRIFLAARDSRFTADAAVYITG